MSIDHSEELTPNVNECISCRRAENTDRMKSIEELNQLAALKNEEIKLKSLHRRLEMRIKQFLQRTSNSILMEEKLLNIEKCSQKELLQREKLLNHKKIPKKDYKIFWNNIQKLEENNGNLQKRISSLCNKIKQIEKDSQTKIYQKISQNLNNNKNRKSIAIPNEDNLHRMNEELNQICADNAALRSDIKRMLNKRRQMTEEYNRVNGEMQNATNETRQLTAECSENFANRRNLVERMRSMYDQHDHDEKKLLADIRELDRLLENHNTSKSFLVKKSNIRQEQIQLNEFFAGKRSEGTKSAYTADDFHRLFRIYFNQDFVKEKVLHRTVETFLNEQEQSFGLFEYAVELINELNHLHEDLGNKRKYISNIFSNDNIESFTIKDIFTTLEYSVNEANMNVQSLENAKRNLRELLDKAYQLILNLFFELNCEENRILSINQTINDRNVLLYLATIESRLQQLLPHKRRYHKDGKHHHHHHTDDTTISWRIEQSYNSLLMNTKENNREIRDNLHEIDLITPQILSVEQNQMIDDERFNNRRTLPEDVINTVLDVYNECGHQINTNIIEQIKEIK